MSEEPEECEYECFECGQDCPFNPCEMRRPATMPYQAIAQRFSAHLQDARKEIARLRALNAAVADENINLRTALAANPIEELKKALAALEGKEERP